MSSLMHSLGYEDAEHDQGSWEILDSNDSRIGFLAIWWDSSSSPTVSNEWLVHQGSSLPTTVKLVKLSLGAPTGSTISIRSANAEDKYNTWKTNNSWSAGGSPTQRQFVGDLTSPGWTL